MSFSPGLGISIHGVFDMELEWGLLLLFNSKGDLC